MNKKEFKKHCHNIRLSYANLNERMSRMYCGQDDHAYEQWKFKLDEYIKDKPFLKYWIENRHEISDLEYREREINYLKETDHHIDYKDFYFEKLKFYISLSLERRGVDV